MKYLPCLCIVIVLLGCSDKERGQTPAKASSSPSDEAGVLVQQSSSSSDDVRMTSVLTIRKLGVRGVAAVPALRKRLKEESNPKITEAIDITILMLWAHNRAYMAVHEPFFEVRNDAVLELESLGRGGPSFAHLRGMKVSPKQGYYQECVDIIVPALIQALCDDESVVRHNASSVLGSYPSNKSSVLPLIDRLKDPDHGVRQMAAISLGQLEDARAVKPLISTLKDSDTQVRVSTVEALARIGAPSKEAIPIMEEMKLKDSDETVRAWCKDAVEYLKKK